MHYVKSNTCTFCNTEPETLSHLFYDCKIVKKMWEADDDFRLFCGQLDALASLPIDAIRNSAPCEAASFLDDFDASYVTGELRPRVNGVPADGLRLNCRRIDPIFPPRQWNMHDVTLANQPRTNNVSEGWNNKLQTLVGHNHPRVWTLVVCMAAECARVCGILLHDENKTGVRVTSDQTPPFV